MSAVATLASASSSTGTSTAVLERFGFHPGDTVFCPSSGGVKCTEADVVDLCSELGTCRSITSLDLSQASIGVEAAAALKKVVGGRTTLLPLQHLRLSHCNINHLAFTELAVGIAGCYKLEILDLSSNPLRDEAVDALAMVLGAVSTLRILNVTECKIGPAGTKTLCDAMRKYSCRLRQLLLAGNKLRAAGVTTLCDFLGASDLTATITTLDLSANCINAEGGRAIAAMLMRNAMVESLKLGTNYISDSAPHIVGALSHRTTSGKPLRLCDFSNNRIDVNACREVSRTLEGRRFTVSCFSLERNTVGDDGLIAYFHAMKGSPVQFLDLSDCGLSHRSGVVLADLISSCPLLNSIQVDGNHMNDDAICEIAEAFAASPSLVSLNLERTGCGSQGVRDLARAVQRKYAIHLSKQSEDAESAPNVATTSPSRPASISPAGLRSLNLAENTKIELPALLELLDALATPLTGVGPLEDLDLSDLPCVVECEPLLRALVELFASNPSLQRVLLERTGLTSLLPPPGILTRSVAAALEHAVRGSATMSASTDSSIDRTSHANNASGLKKRIMSSSSSPTQAGSSSEATSVVGVRGVSSMLKRLSPSPTVSSHVKSSPGKMSALSAAAPPVNPATVFRPTWALSVPVDTTQSPYIPPADAPDDGRFAALVPLKGSLHDPLYPGYGKGLFSNAVTLQSLNNPMPFRVKASRVAAPFIPTADGASLVAQAPKKALRVSPYSLEALEQNACQLPVTQDQLRRKFAELDVDGSGYLDYQEFFKLYLTFPNYGVPQNEEQAKRLFKKVARSDNRIDFDEFCVLMLNMAAR